MIKRYSGILYDLRKVHCDILHSVHKPMFFPEKWKRAIISITNMFFVRLKGHMAQLLCKNNFILQKSVAT